MAIIFILIINLVVARPPSLNDHQLAILAIIYSIAAVSIQRFVPSFNLKSALFLLPYPLI